MILWRKNIKREWDWVAKPDSSSYANTQMGQGLRGTSWRTLQRRRNVSHRATSLAKLLETACVSRQKVWPITTSVKIRRWGRSLTVFDPDKVFYLEWVGLVNTLVGFVTTSTIYISPKHVTYLKHPELWVQDWGFPSVVGIAERVSQTRPKITPFDEFPPPIMREQPNFMVLAYVRSLRVQQFWNKSA